MADALRRISIIGSFVDEVDVGDATQVERAAASSAEGDVNIWFGLHPRTLSIRGARIVWAIFESDCLSQNYVEFLNQSAHVVWVPSHWGRGVLLASGVPADRIDVVPEGVDADLYHDHARGALVRHGRPFRFLAVGKFEKRKAYAELLSAFAQAFAGDASVQLVIKADYFLSGAEKKRSELSRLVAESGLANVRLLWGAWSSEQLANLYTDCDAFVMPSRAEAWGLPGLEAIASGLPVAAVCYSGVTEYLREVTDSVAAIEYSLVPIDDPEFFKFWPTLVGVPVRWAQPSVASIAECLRSLKDRHDAYRKAAHVNSLKIRQQFSWASAAARAMDSIVGRQLMRLQPGERSTGSRALAGKARVARNAYPGWARPLARQLARALGEQCRALISLVARAARKLR
jgi:glycosyltransferase involved in cell wall biosynthesis